MQVWRFYSRHKRKTPELGNSMGLMALNLARAARQSIVWALRLGFIQTTHF